MTNIKMKAITVVMVFGMLAVVSGFDYLNMLYLIRQREKYNKRLFRLKLLTNGMTSMSNDNEYFEYPNFYCESMNSSNNGLETSMDPCEVCVKFIDEMQVMLQTEEAWGIIKYVCNELPEPENEVCKMAVKKMIEELIEYEPEEVCKWIKLC
jgi:hypothetical protein